MRAHTNTHTCVCMCVCVFGWFGCSLWHISTCGLFNAKPYLYIYIYIYVYTIIIIIIKSYREYRILWLSLAIPSLLSISLRRSSTQHPVSAHKSLFIEQQWHVQEWASIRENPEWIHTYFFSSAVNILFVLIEWFVKSGPAGCTAAILWGVASRICSKQHAV